MRRLVPLRLAFFLLIFSFLPGFFLARAGAAPPPPLPSVGSSTLGSVETATWWGLNVKLHPVVLLLGVASLDVDYRLAESFTAGLVGTFFNRDLFGVNLRGNMIGARGTYAFRGAFSSGAYLAGQLERGRLEASTPDLWGRSASVTSEPTNLSFLCGYQWFGERFNFNIGAGYLRTDIGRLALRDLNGQVVREISLPFPPVTGELALGVTF